MLVSCEFTMVHDELHPFSNHAEFNDVFTLSHEYAVLIDSHTIHVPLNSWLVVHHNRLIDIQITET